MENNTALNYYILAGRDYDTCITLEGFLPDEWAIAGVLFHIQQAVEKMLKALWVVNGHSTIPINDIHLLADPNAIADSFNMCVDKETPYAMTYTQQSKRLLRDLIPQQSF